MIVRSFLITVNRQSHSTHLIPLRSISKKSMHAMDLVASESKEVVHENIKLYNGMVVERLSEKLVVEYNNHASTTSSSSSITSGGSGDSSNSETSTIICKQKLTLANENVVVGDRVEFSIDETSTPITGLVLNLKERMNVLERPAPASAGRRKTVMKTIASNIDQIVIVTSVKPKVPLYTIDQLIVAAVNINIPNITLVLNKFDQPEAKELYDSYKHYKDLGYNVLRTSTLENNETGISELESYLCNKTTIFIGQSGVGKSSLVNMLNPQAVARIGDLVSKVELGAHTTSNARMYHLPNGGKMIDSPGIREFGLWCYDVNMITKGFVEIDELSKDCKFSDCNHQSNSKGCAVIAGVKSGKVHRERLLNYRKILESIHTNGR